MPGKPIVLWFRRDLRLADHSALSAAVRGGEPVVPLYILDDASPGPWKLGGASRWWLGESLAALAGGLAKRGNRLILRRGDTERELMRLVGEVGAGAVYFTRAYEPWAAALEHRLKSTCDAAKIEFRRFGGQLLRQPEDMQTAGGGFYRIYTPFAKAFSKDFVPPKPLPPPKAIEALAMRIKSDRIDDWALHPEKPDWTKGLAAEWTPGEAGAQRRLADFSAAAVATYAHDRDYPARHGTSRLSPHLAFGEIAVAACWRAASHGAGEQGAADRSRETFLKELLWREFSSHLLVHVPALPSIPFRKEYESFPWRDDQKHVEAWRRGRTGYPIVDAGMRELWTTGYMHNRVRMIAASFLIKHLMCSWQSGEAWFWDTLVDADLASNAANWQWVAGSGADAAPYFRIFNPALQGEKFDPEGCYVRRWIPELARLPDAVIHAPWIGDADTLANAGVKLGKSYPYPIVDHREARAGALAAYERMRNLQK